MQAHANADGLSRLPLTTNSTEGQSLEASIFNLAQIDCLPVTATQVQQATRVDPCLSKVMPYTRDGWPASVPEALKPYRNRHTQLSVEGDCLLWGTHVIIPKKLQGSVLNELHSNHPGVSRMKSVARSCVWWPSLDQNIEDLVKGCIPCQSVKSAPPIAPLHPWIWPSKPWQRIHVDFAGPFLGRMFIVIVDARSKWPEVYEMSSTSTDNCYPTACFSCIWVATATIVSDNGPQFASSEFAQFLKANGVKHIRCAHYHPSSNGLPERFVKTFKQAMKTGEHHGTPLKHRLANFLLSYRTTPHATTNHTPSSLFLNRAIQTRLDLLKPNCADQVVTKQSQQLQNHDNHAKARDLIIGQQVMTRNFRGGSKWVPGVIVERQGPLMYSVEVASGVCWKHHVDHLRDRGTTTVNSGIQLSEEVDLSSDAFINLPSSQSPATVEPNNATGDINVPSISNDSSGTVPTQPQYPTRTCHPPDRYGH